MQCKHVQNKKLYLFFSSSLPSEKVKEDLPFSKISTLLEHMKKNISQYLWPELEGKREKTFKVPKILHFIWLGAVIPEQYLLNILLARKLNPDYEVLRCVPLKIKF